MKKLMATAFALMILMGNVSSLSIYAKEKETVETPLVKIEWKSENGKYKGYDEEGNELSGWIKDSYKCWYYFDPSAENVMKTGWLAGKNEDGLKWYYFKNNGQLAYGWQTIEGQKYYLLKEGYYAGSAVTGTQEIDGINYSFDASGMLVGQSNKGTPLYSGYEKVDTMVVEILDEIIKPGMSETEELRAIHDWMCNNISYGGGRIVDESMDLGKLADGLKDVWSAGELNKSKLTYVMSYLALRDKKGVCDEYVALFNTLADALGYKTTIMTGQYDGRGHVISLVWIDGQWIVMDVQLDDYKDDGSIFTMGFLPTYEEYSSHYKHSMPHFDFYNPKDAFVQNTEYWWDNSEYYDEFDSMEEYYEKFTQNFHYSGPESK